MDNDKIQVDILGLSPTPAPGGGGYALILKEIGGDRRLPIIIGSFEAQHIALELEGIKPPRPLTHDLIKNIIEQLGFSISYVYINELRDGTFFAKIKMDVGSVDEVDSRPSDAIALALKFAVPIYVNEDVMNEVAFLPDKEGDEEGLEEDLFKQSDTADLHEKPADPYTRRLNKLQTDLKTAIDSEDYEKAASLRDEIKKLELSR
ncbi:MAG TPA: bifunctional nuclease family protein [Ignavibacteria bacterium]|nr:bifunctional nuclease family protein [Ignavibacteria bacterium]HMR00010.1 bifunctional nuclease family protein [Ignavibacteria bacterium]